MISTIYQKLMIKPPKRSSKTTQSAIFILDITEGRTEEGKLYLFVAIDRTSTVVYVEFLHKYGKAEAAQFLHNLIRMVPYKIHTILTDSGIQLISRKVDKYAWMHIFDRICHDNQIDHRLTKISHSWTNGQVERMNRTLKEATVTRYHYNTHDPLKKYLAAFVNAYNFSKRLKTLKGLTPYEFIIKTWQSQSQRFILHPNHHNLALYT